MSEFFEEFERAKREICEPLRREAGFDSEDPDCYYGCGTEAMWNYITALENALTAERHVGRMIFRSFK